MQDDIEQFGDVGSLDDNVESFLSHDGGDGKDLYGSLKPSPAEPKPEPSKGRCVFYYILHLENAFGFSNSQRSYCYFRLFFC